MGLGGIDGSGLAPGPIGTEDSTLLPTEGEELEKDGGLWRVSGKVEDLTPVFCRTGEPAGTRLEELVLVLV